MVMTSVFSSWLVLFSASLAAIPKAQTAKNEFVFNNRGEPETIDPAKATGVPDNTIVVQLFEGLLAKKADWVTLIPGHAEAMPKVSTDGKVYTFRLRENLKWSDGSAITSQDYVYSWMRAIHPNTLAQYAFWLTDNIVGAMDYFKNPSEENAKKVGIVALDPRTLQVTLNKPLGYFKAIVAESIFFPVKKSVVEKFGDGWTRPGNLVSAGPYKLLEWKVQDRIVLVKDPHYYDAAKVTMDKVVALPLEDRQTALNLFRQGKLDWTGHNGFPNSLVPVIAKSGDPTLRLFPGFTSYYYWLNTRKEPLNNPLVRQALALAIDRETIVNQVTKGGETAADFSVPPNTGNYISPKGLSSGNYAKDVERAKKLLEEAGYGPGKKSIRPLKLIYNTDENHKKVAQAVQNMVKKALGIDLVLQNLEWKVYLKTQEAGDFDMSRAGWQGDYPDPAAFLENSLSFAGNNHSGWKNPEFDKLFDQANRTNDEAKRLNLLNQAEALVLKDVPFINVYMYTNFHLLRPEIHGFEKNLIDRPFIRYISKK